MGIVVGSWETRTRNEIVDPREPENGSPDFDIRFQAFQPPSLPADLLIMSLQVRKTPEGLTFSVFVQPRASKNEAAGVYRNALKIRLTAPPVEGKANKQCTDFLAKSLKVPKSSVQIVSGQTGRNKQVKVACPPGDHAELRRRILALAG
jgi:uncharacterized protein (TIGR00251 family)